MFSWTKRLVRQVVQRILDTVLLLSRVTAHWVAYQQNLCQTWEWAFSALWDEIVMKCHLPPLQKNSWSSLWPRRGSADWKLALATDLYQDKFMATAAADLQHTCKELRTEIRNEALCALGSWQDRTSDRYFEEKILEVPNLASFHT